MNNLGVNNLDINNLDINNEISIKFVIFLTNINLNKKIRINW